MIFYSEVEQMETAIEFKNIKKAYGEKVVMEGFNPVSYTHLTLPTKLEV